MRKLLILIAVLVVAASGWKAYELFRPRADYDGQGNHYRLRIDADKRIAHIEADLWLSSDMLSMFDVQGVEGLPNGHLDLVENLQVSDAQGQPIRLRDLGQGDYALRGAQRIKLSYQVQLKHDQYTWPAGTEEVGYWTEQGLMIGGSRLFFSDGEQQLQGDIRVEVELPAGWNAYTPWAAADAPNRFAPSSRRDLLSNVMFFGTAHAERISEGGVELTLLLGERYVAAAPMFRDLLSTQLRSYFELFGGAPLSKHYLIIINEGASGDGGAFHSSFSQYIKGDADPINRVNWGYVMAHELLHFWNGLSLRPADHREEWFKEGATDYLTIQTLARNGQIDEALLLKRLENVPRRYVVARLLQRLRLDLRRAGFNKEVNRQLVYGGGSLAAWALDVKLREVSSDKIGLPELMRALYADRAGFDKTYTLDDIERIAEQLTEHDFRSFFAEAVESEAVFDITPYVRGGGLRIDSFLDEVYIQRDPAAEPAAAARFDAMFSPPQSATAVPSLAD